ncbi:MAG: NAD-dependent malic enzyme [bacterium]|nr:NAD-dependent malic enzyme [bacterium]
MKRFEMRIDPLTQEVYYAVPHYGYQLMNDPLLNKGNAFTLAEREEFQLSGLTAEVVGSLESQLERAYGNYSMKTTDMERYITLMGLLDRNETLFYSLLTRHITEMLPIVYTPTVGQACLNMSHIIRRYRGIYVSQSNVNHIEQVLRNVGLPDISLIVVTDGERILGYGDLGVDGMPIPIGKLALYVAAAGIHPAATLPVVLDVGTNNERLLNDPLYIGVQKSRLPRDAYLELVERFVQGIKRVFPRALLQWEDFGKQNAFTLLSKYNSRIPSFNDDIQGTGATASAALMTAKKITGKPLSQERIAILGFGQAGSGVANALVTQMTMEEGISITEARRRIFAMDMPGLLLEGMQVEPHQQPFLQPREAVAGWSADANRAPNLREVVEHGKITILIGLSAQAGVFDESMLHLVSANTERPIIFALSNPTSCSEATPNEIIPASNGRAIMAFGSPFAPYKHTNGKEYVGSQCNNLYVFPGVGLGAIVSQSSRVTHSMFHAASKAVSSMVTPDLRAAGLLLPPLKDIRRISFEVGLAVAKQAREEGIGLAESDDRLSQLIRDAMWVPHYYPYRHHRE